MKFQKSSTFYLSNVTNAIITLTQLNFKLPTNLFGNSRTRWKLKNTIRRKVLLIDQSKSLLKSIYQNNIFFWYFTISINVVLGNVLDNILLKKF